MKKYTKLFMMSLFSLSTAMANEQSCDALIQKLQGSMKNPAALQILVPQIVGLKIDCSNPQEAEKQIFGALWQLESNKKLDSSILLLVRAIRRENKIPALNNVSDELAVGTLSLAIKSELYDRGHYTPAFLFQGWEGITRSQDRILSTLPKVSSFKSDTFKRVFRQLTGMPMTSISNSEVLGENGRSFEKRIEIVRAARQSIKLATWGYYDDGAGRRFADELIAASKRKVKVQVLVDHLVSLRPGYGNELARMRRAGIEVIGWKSAANPFYGMHSKMLLVDDLYCVEGGRNIGDLYLLNGKWSDLDVYHEGAIAQVINPNIFATLWNEQISLQRLNNRKLPMVADGKLPDGEVGTFMSAPQHQVADSVSNMTIYAIMNAKKEIDIANAYFISTPGLRKSLAQAIRRGVKVRIYSNSMKSVDEPIVSIPIQKSLKEMYDLGAEIYIKNGQTLHTKIFKADDLSWYGSYNLHPRSGRYELEKITVSTDNTLNRDLDLAHEDSLKLGKRVTSGAELASPEHVGLDILFNAIFNQL